MRGQKADDPDQEEPRRAHESTSNAGSTRSRIARSVQDLRLASRAGVATAAGNVVLRRPESPGGGGGPERPVLPLRMISCPARTVSPSCTIRALPWQYAQWVPCSSMIVTPMPQVSQPLPPSEPQPRFHQLYGQVRTTATRPPRTA